MKYKKNMRNFKSNRNKCIIERAKQIQALLKTDLCKNRINQQIKKKFNVNQEINFDNSKYSNGKQYCFPYSPQNALSIINNCQYHDNLYELLINGYHEGDLNLHSSLETIEDEWIQPEFENEKFDSSVLTNSKFAQSNLSKKAYFDTLEISSWSYEDVIVSAIYYHLKNLYYAYLKRIRTSENKSFFELTTFSSRVALLLLNNIYGKQLFVALQTTNLFVVYRDCWLYGFTSALKSLGLDVTRPYEIQDRLYFFKYINKNFLANFNYISFYLQAFENFIPQVAIDLVSKCCNLTKSVHVLYYILKMYQNALNSTLTNEKKNNQYCYFSNSLENELHAALKKFSVLNNLSQFFNSTKLFNSDYLSFIVLLPISVITDNNFVIMNIGFLASPDKSNPASQISPGGTQQSSPAKLEPKKRNSRTEESRQRRANIRQYDEGTAIVKQQVLVHRQETDSSQTWEDSLQENLLVINAGSPCGIPCLCAHNGVYFTPLGLNHQLDVLKKKQRLYEWISLRGQ